MFNARAFETERSIFKVRLSGGFRIITAIIVVSQVIIVELLYNLFNVQPMFHYADSWAFNTSGATDWLMIVLLSSIVIWVREAALMLKKL